MKKVVPLIISPLFLLILVFFVYWYTKPPSILWIDSGTMIAASASLGIPNPPGFPFYMVASNLFTRLPFANVLTRLELFTIIFSLALLFVVYQIIELILKEYFSDSAHLRGVKAHLEGVNPTHHSSLITLTSLFGTIALAFSYQYWSQSQNTEAFIFSYSFVTLFAYLMLKIVILSPAKPGEESQKGKDHSLSLRMTKEHYKSFLFKILLLTAFLYGLAAGTNPTTAAMVPGVLFTMYLVRKTLSVPKLIILGATFIIVLAVVYSYLPLRAKTYPFVNWGNPQTVKLFVDHLHGAGLNINEPGPAGSVNGFTGSPLVFAQSTSYFILSSFFQFTPVLWPLILLGAWQIFRKNRQVFIILTSVPLFNVIYSGLYLSGNQESWFILSWIFFAIFIAIGFYHLALSTLSTLSLGRSVTSNDMSNVNGQMSIVKLLALFSLSFLPLLVFFIPLNRSGHYYSADYAYNLYSPLEENAILIGTGDFFDSLSHYLKVADVYRKDVTPITANVFYVNRWNRDTLKHTTNISISDKLEQMIQYKSFTEYNEVMNQLIDENIDSHPIYVNHLTLRASALARTTAGQLRLDERFKFVPNGLSLRVVRASQQAGINLRSYDYKFRSPINIHPFYLERNYKGAFGNILNDYIYGWESLADWYADKKQDEQALKYYKAAKDLGENAEVYAHLGEFWAQRGDFNASYQYLEKAERLDVNNLGIHFNLGLSYVNLGRNLEAVQEFEAVKQLTPPNDPAYQEAEKIIRELNIIDLNDPTLAAQTASWQTVKDEKHNLVMKFPPGFSKENTQNSILISDGNPGNLGLNIEIIGEKLGENEDIEERLKKPPPIILGTLLDVQKISFANYNAMAQIYGTTPGDSQQRFVLTKSGWLWQFKVYPGNSVKLPLVYKILSTFEPMRQ